MWHDHKQVTPDDVRSLLQWFSEPEIIEIGVLVGQFMGMGQLFAVLGIPNPVINHPDDREAER
jgi:hypothetical protein